MAFSVVNRKKRLIVGLSTVFILATGFTIGFIFQKPSYSKTALMTVDIFKDPIKESLAFYEASPDEDCVRVINEYSAPPTKKTKTKNPPSFVDAPLIYASAPKCKAAGVRPADYQKLGEDGFVTLVLNVNKEGKIEHGEVEKTSGFPDLDEAALRHVTDNWEFTPCQKLNTPVACRQKIKFRWKG